MTNLKIHSIPEIATVSPAIVGNHLRPLDSLRGLAALYVAIHHALQLSEKYLDQMPLPLKAISKIFAYGHYSVDVFIVLSGFCLMLPVVRNGGVMRGTFMQFYIKRARRILPPYYLALLLSIVLIFTCIGQPTGGAWDMSLSVQSKDVLTHLFLVHDLFKDTRVTINPAFWSIAVEWRIYFLFPVIVLLWKKWGSLKTTVTLTGASCLFFLIFSRFPALNLDPIGPSPHFIALFAFGMLAADIVFTDSELNTVLRKEFPWIGISLVCLLLSLPTYQFFSAGGQSWIIADLLMGISSFSILVAIFSPEPNQFTKFLNLPFLVKLGAFSYSIYLVHMPLLQIFVQYVLKPLSLNSSLNFFLVLFIAIPMMVLASYVFFVICEKPFLSKNAQRNIAPIR